MSTRVFIHGPPDLENQEHQHKFGGLDFETALARLLYRAGQLEWDEETNPTCWSVSLRLYDHVDPEVWAEQLVSFLTDWGVPDGTVVSFIHYPLTGGVRHFQVAVPDNKHPAL